MGSILLSPLSEHLITLVPKIVWLANEQGVVVRLNSSWQRYTGIEVEAALGENFWQAFHRNDRSALEVAWQNGIARQQPWQERVRIRLADGSYEWFEVTAQPLHGTMVEATIGVGIEGGDIENNSTQDNATLWFGTINRLASTGSDPHLLAGQEFSEALFENVSEGLVACNSAGQIVLFNRAAQEFHGLPPEPISPDLWANYYDLYDGSGEQLLTTQDVPLMRALTGEKVRAAEIMVKPKTGQARSLMTNADPIVDATGRQLGAVALMCDITAQKQLEADLIATKLELEVKVAERTAQLVEREAQFRSTFEHAAIGCCHVALDGQWLRVNEKLCEIVGYKREDLLQKTFQDITHPEDLAEDLALVEHLMRGTIPHYSLEKRYIREDDSIVWVRITISLRRRESAPEHPLGEPMYFIGMVEDISDRKQLELQDQINRQALEKAKQSLEKRNQELDQFVYIASHDLKAPLRGISNLSEWLEEDLAGQLPPDNQEQLVLMRSRVKRMENLINGLLQYSRLGRSEMNVSPVDSRALLLEVIDSLDPPTTFQIQLPEIMPSLQTQRLLLSQVFSNLLSNAIGSISPLR